MLLGMHTYSLYHHGVAEDWAGFKLPWGRQITFFEMMDYMVEVGLDGLHLDGKSLDQLDHDYLEKVKQYAAEKNLYLEFNFALKSGNYDSSVQFNIDEGIDIARLEPVVHTDNIKPSEIDKNVLDRLIDQTEGSVGNRIIGETEIQYRNFLLLRNFLRPRNRNKDDNECKYQYKAPKSPHSAPPLKLQIESYYQRC